jgi:GNAT superfamily N-acetyltransferase
MCLEFIDHRRGSADRYSWTPPFDQSVTYENERWWDEPRYYCVSEPWFVQVRETGMEVARVEFDDPGGINPEYIGVPELDGQRLEIQFIEVAAARTRRGIGTQVVRGLAELHRGRRLFAYSENADEFWASLGWERFEHRDGQPQFHRALFIQPNR